MQVITVNEYILGNRFMAGNEVAWYKNQDIPTKIATILTSDEKVTLIVYKRYQSGLFWMDNVKIFETLLLVKKYVKAMQSNLG